MLDSFSAVFVNWGLSSSITKYFASSRSIFFTATAAAALGIHLRCTFIVLKHYFSGFAKNLEESGLYIGSVKHSRLKGGNTHHFSYPIFFSLLDLDEIKSIGWSMWPIFKVNGGSHSFCSLDYKDHLRDAVGVQSSPESNNHLADRARAFIHEKCDHKEDSPGRIKLLAHMTYFGYCFNPISIFYQLFPDDRNNDDNNTVLTDRKTDDTHCNTGTAINTIITEVSNTPWIEQHSYALHESVNDVEVTRNSDGTGSFLASWNKEFHVSPFMEMDYRYTFTFSEPRDTLWVKSKMTKISTNEVWFTASFELKKIPFSPLNILYVLIAYPVFTRTIQVLIHWEAVKLWLKGIPTFEHPNGTDVDLGFGISGKRLGAFLGALMSPGYDIYNRIIRSSR